MSPSSEQYAQIAALFTTGEEVAQKTTVELLIPAHLPVQGGLWLVPYAGRASGSGTAMLVRMHEDTVDIAAIGHSQVQLESCNSLESMMQQIEEPIQQWIVQPPANADPTSLLHCDADVITLLSGADQAAVVGAYRLLKGFVTAAQHVDELPPIRIVIVGAEERAANDAAGRIVQTAKHQLGMHIEVGHPLPAMGSQSKVQSQGSIPRSCNLIDLMARIRITAQPDIELQTTDRVPAPEIAEPIEHSNAVEQNDTTIEEGSTPVLIEESVLSEAIASEAKLSTYVEGLLAISPRCPEHEEIELTVDAKGCIHLLAPAESFREAAIVSSWIAKHHALIAMACGGLQINETKSAVQHLFTDDAVSVADLHGTGVKLHLLTEVEVGGSSGPFSTPLN